MVVSAWRAQNEMIVINNLSFKSKIGITRRVLAWMTDANQGLTLHAAINMEMPGRTRSRKVMLIYTWLVRRSWCSSVGQHRCRHSPERT